MRASASSSPACVCGFVEPLCVADAVAEEPQRPRRSDPRIELAQAPGGRVARVGELLLAALPLTRVERLEVALVHQHLAAHLEQLRRMGGTQPERDTADGAQVRGHVLARKAVAARRAPNECAVLVGEIDRQPVELRFAAVLDRRDVERLAHAPVERLDLVVAEGVVDREHRHAVRDGRELLRRRGADALCRRVGSDELGMVGFERLKLAQEAIVLGVADRRRVEHVVAVVRLVDRGA